MCAAFTPWTVTGAGRLNLIVGFASELSKPAFEPDSEVPTSPYSFFTEALIKRIEEAGAHLDFGALLEDVTRDVVDETKGQQEPWMYVAKKKELLLLREVGSTPLLDEPSCRATTSGPRLTVGDVVSPLSAVAKATVSTS